MGEEIFIIEGDSLHFGNLTEDMLGNKRYLSEDGKCYDCKIQFSGTCEKCKLVKNENGNKSLKCISCAFGYYFTQEGNCIDYTYLIKNTQNCFYYEFLFGNLTNYFYEYVDYFFDEDFFPSDIDYDIRNYLSKGFTPFNSKCVECNESYFVNEQGNCEKINYEIFYFNSIINRTKIYDTFKNLCNDNNKVLITYVFINEKGNIEEINLNNFNSFSNFTNKIGDKKACLSNSGLGGENAPKNLKYCKEAYFYFENNSYICSKCLNDYTFSTKSQICHKNNQNICTIINKGNEINPDYHSSEWKYKDKIFTLITYENGEKEFVETEGDLTGCTETMANTTYLKVKYNCTKCSFMYILYYGKFFERYICQNMKNKIIKENQISYDNFNITEKVKAVNGSCDKPYLFSPDDENCYKCDDELVGILGCQQGCSFSLKRNRILKCESGCKRGYIESAEGVCSPCRAINEGCHECHYENNYPLYYEGIQRKRTFVCNYCEEGYIQFSSGECQSCQDIGLNNCSKCELDSNNDSFICTQCQENYFINDYEQCQFCDDYHFKGLNSSRCFICDNILEGGIDKCSFCESTDDKVICNQCKEGYILFTNNNSCLEISKNKE